LHILKAAGGACDLQKVKHGHARQHSSSAIKLFIIFTCV